MLAPSLVCELLLGILLVTILFGLPVLWNKIPKSIKISYYTKFVACILLILLFMFEANPPKYFIAVVIYMLLQHIWDFGKLINKNDQVVT